MRSPIRRAGAAAAACLSALALVRGLPAQGEHYTLTGNDIAIYDLAGEIRLEPGSGGAVQVEVTRVGADARRLEVATGPIEDRATLRVIFPASRISYPGLRGNSSTSLRVREDGTFGDDDDERGRGERVTITGRGGGLEAGANLRIAVPDGGRVAVYLAVGSATVTNVRGQLRIDASSADITASGVRGAMHFDTGSGNVKVTTAEGDLMIDTGSGNATASRVRGGRLEIDTGSGSVNVSNVQVARLDVDVGSGSIDATAVNSPDVRLESGSGSVDLALTADVDNLDIDSGSGSVTVRLPESVGAEIEVETGSGGIRTELPIQITKYRRDEITGRIGDGRGRITIETGSGGVRLLKP